MRLAFGTTDNRSVDPTAKQFDLIQGFAVFILSMTIPPVVVNTDGSYSPYYPTIKNADPSTIQMGFQPLNFTGTFSGLVNGFLALPNE